MEKELEQDIKNLKAKITRITNENVRALRIKQLVEERTALQRKLWLLQDNVERYS